MNGNVLPVQVLANYKDAIPNGGHGTTQAPGHTQRYAAAQRVQN